MHDAKFQTILGNNNYFSTAIELIN